MARLAPFTMRTLMSRAARAHGAPSPSAEIVEHGEGVREVGLQHDSRIDRRELSSEHPLERAR